MRDLELENLLLRHQLNLMRQKHPSAYRASVSQKWFFCLLRRFYSRWQDAMIMFEPDTIVKWQRNKFRLFWNQLCRRHKTGRPKIDWEIIKLIRRLKKENPTWGAPRITHELHMLGFDLHQNTVSNYMPKTPTPPDQIKRWKAFLKNHAEDLCAMDFFTVPTLHFKQLYGFLIIHHKTRKILHFNTTFHPCAEWVKQQLRDAFPWESAPKYMIFDNDTIFKPVKTFLEKMGTKPKVTAIRSPWQNAYCERVIGTIRRDLLDHVIVFNEGHLRRLMGEYLDYYHEDRTHLGLLGQTPGGREVMPRPSSNAKVIALPRVGGLHHRYVWEDAA